MLSTRGGMQAGEFLRKAEEVEIGCTSIEKGNLLSALGVCGCSFCVEQYTVLLGAQKHRVADVISDQGIFCGAESLLAALPSFFLTGRRASKKLRTSF